MASELNLGTLLAYEGNPNNELASGNYGNAGVLKIDPNTQAALKEFGNFIQKKRDDEYTEWHNNQIKALQDAKDTAGIYAGDSKIVNESLMNTLKKITDDPAAFKGDAFLKNQQGFMDMQQTVADHAALVRQSKDFNTFLKNWETKTSTTTGLNNKVNELQKEQLIAAKPEERAALMGKFHPIDDGNKDLQLGENGYYKNPTNTEITYNENPLDAGSYDKVVTGVYDLESYLPVFALAKAESLTRQFELDKGLQETYHNDVNEYIKHEAKNRLREKMIVEKTTRGKNEEYYQNRQDKKQDKALASQEKRNQDNIDSRERIAKDKAILEKTTDFPIVKQNTLDVVNLEGEMAKQAVAVPSALGLEEVSFAASTAYRAYPKVRDMVEATDVVIVDENGSDKKVKANTLVRKVTKDGSITYYPAYTNDQGDLVGDKNNSYDIEQLRDNSLRGESQLSEYKQKNPDAKIQQNKPVSQPTKAVSAEKQLNDPQVNKNLKTSYERVKQIYPSIDTSGIKGDAAHQARKSDHNTMDAIDITNFGSNANGVIAELQKDASVKYIIFNKQIWKKGEGWKPYTGNAHTEHIHVSYVDDNNAPSQPKVAPKKSSGINWKK